MKEIILFMFCLSFGLCKIQINGHQQYAFTLSANNPFHPNALNKAYSVRNMDKQQNFSSLFFPQQNQNSIRNNDLSTKNSFSEKSQSIFSAKKTKQNIKTSFKPQQNQQLKFEHFFAYQNQSNQILSENKQLLESLQPHSLQPILQKIKKKIEFSSISNAHLIQKYPKSDEGAKMYLCQLLQILKKLPLLLNDQLKQVKVSLQELLEIVVKKIRKKTSIFLPQQYSQLQVSQKVIRKLKKMKSKFSTQKQQFNNHQQNKFVQEKENLKQCFLKIYNALCYLLIEQEINQYNIFQLYIQQDIPVSSLQKNKILQAFAAFKNELKTLKMLKSAKKAINQQFFSFLLQIIMKFWKMQQKLNQFLIKITRLRKQKNKTKLQKYTKKIIIIQAECRLLIGHRIIKGVSKILKKKSDNAWKSHFGIIFNELTATVFRSKVLLAQLKQK